MTDMTAHQMMSCDEFATHLADYLEGDASSAVREAMETHAASCERCGALLADLQALPQMAAALPPLAPSRELWSGIAERIDARVLPLDSPRAGRPVVMRRSWLRPAVAAAALMIVTAGITYTLTKESSRVAGTPNIVSNPDAPKQVAVVPTESITVDPVTSRRPSGSTGASGTTTTVARGTESPASGRSVSQPVARLVRNDPLSEAEPVYDREIAKLRVIVRQRRAQLDPATVAVLEQSIAVIDSAIAQSRAALARDPASGFLATQLNHSLDKKVELLRTAALLPSRT